MRRRDVLTGGFMPTSLVSTQICSVDLAFLITMVPSSLIISVRAVRGSLLTYSLASGVSLQIKHQAVESSFLLV